MDVIKREFEGLFRRCKSYLYAVIFNEVEVEKRGKKKVEKKKRENRAFPKEQKGEFS